MGEFRMPSLGADMEAGTIIEWRVRPGDKVERGDIVAVVDTDKADIEVEVFETGVIDELVVPPGVEVPVGTLLARINPAHAGPPSVAPAPATTAPGTVAPAPAIAAVPPAVPPATARRRRSRRGPAAREAAPSSGDRLVRASPLARRRAAEGGVDLAAIVGSGPDGAVLAADIPAVDAASAAVEPAPRHKPAPGREGDRRLAMRRAIGTLMARSKREIPHYYLATTIDFSAADAWLAAANASRPVTERLLPAALLLRATALAAREVPVMNGAWASNFQPSSVVHLGVAVALRGGGLVAPAILDADHLELDRLMASLRDIVTRARSGALRSSEMSDPTITVTNLGDLGVDEVFGVIYPPQVALVGFGRIVERPWAADGMLGVRPVVRATLAADHRVSDGHDGARFLSTIDRLLQHPEAL